MSLRGNNINVWRGGKMGKKQSMEKILEAVDRTLDTNPELGAEALRALATIVIHCERDGIRAQSVPRPSKPEQRTGPTPKDYPKGSIYSEEGFKKNMDEEFYYGH